MYNMFHVHSNYTKYIYAYKCTYKQNGMGEAMWSNKSGCIEKSASIEMKNEYKPYYKSIKKNQSSEANVKYRHYKTQIS